MELKTTRIEKPETVNFVLGQTRDTKTIEDMHEALVRAVPHIGFGAAFCEASGERLVRCTGTDATLIELAKTNAAAIGAGDTFIVLFGAAFSPRDVLIAIKAIPGVCGIYCASANPTEVIVATTMQGRGIIGVIDGFVPNGIETDEDIAWRKDYLLHVVGYRK